MSNFIERLGEIKKIKCILQKDIAKNIKVSLRSYQRYENGERLPTYDIIIRLADYFDVSTDYLLGRTDNPNSHKL